MVTKNRMIKDFKIYKVQGFSAFELIGVLAVLIFLILATNKVMNNINKTKEYNELGDQAKNFSLLANRYLEDNYRDLVLKASASNEIIKPYTEISNYISSGISAFNKYNQVPCIYMVSDNNTKKLSSVRAYLIFGNSQALSSTTLTTTDVANIARAVGGNAGALVNNNGNYLFEGSVESQLIFSTATIERISSVCGFVTPLPSNSLIIDLSKNNTLFASLKGRIDRQSTPHDPDPSLKSVGSESETTIQTNLYLDNVYSESSANIGQQHVYRSLDYGKDLANDGQRVQIKSAASNGVGSANSQLNISNAGLQAAYFAPNSHTIKPGTDCNESELGKIAQDLSKNSDYDYRFIIVSQIQCTYNPTFCGNKYCYLPIKTSSFIYSYYNPRSSIECPSGTLMDNNQPSDSIIESASCGSMSGWMLTRGAHGVNYACYSGEQGLGFCQGLQTVCSYTKDGQTQDLSVNAINKVKCTNSTSSYLIDNYQPQ